MIGAAAAAALFAAGFTLGIAISIAIFMNHLLRLERRVYQLQIPARVPVRK